MTPLDALRRAEDELIEASRSLREAIEAIRPGDDEGMECERIAKEKAHAPLANDAR